MEWKDDYVVTENYLKQYAEKDLKPVLRKTLIAFLLNHSRFMTPEHISKYLGINLVKPSTLYTSYVALKACITLYRLGFLETTYYNPNTGRHRKTPLFRFKDNKLLVRIILNNRFPDLETLKLLQASKS